MFFDRQEVERPAGKDTRRNRGTKALTPANLGRDFGAHAALTQAAVSSFYLLLNRTASSRVRAHLEQWFRHFQTIYGDAAIAARHEAEALARHYGLWGPGVDVPALFFALHTYYVILVNLLALRVAGAVAFSQSGTDPTRVAGLGSEALREYLWENLAEGRLFRTCGLRHFHEGDFFNWYLEAWDPTLARVLSRMVAALAAYPPEALAAGPRAYPDLLKRLYQQLVPAALRHRLGEYYTPDWLAEHLLNRLEGGTFPGNLEKKVLDPACGSGTFLVLVIGRMRAHGLTVERLPAGRVLERILENVVGFDPNPLAVIAARTNYLLAIADLLPYRREEIVIPVYRVDAILSPPSQSFDYVVGNPPWINWESLPEDYRAETRLLWQHYGLFPHGGMDAILGKGKKDLSMLLTYVALDRYLKPGGKLGFVITQSVFKTAGAGQGFRRFTLPGGVPVRVQCVDDLTELRPFEGANNRTSLVVFQKGLPNRYPVPYTYWRRAGRATLRPELKLEEVLARVRIGEFVAEPVAPADPTSAWLTGRPGAVKALKRILGPSGYRAYEGTNTGGANGIYWLELIERLTDGLVRVRNLETGGKRVVDRSTTVLEADLLYPLLRGRDVGKWRATPSALILMAQDPLRRCGFAEEEMVRRYPRTYAYLKRYEATLRQRAAFRRYFTRRTGDGRTVETAPFYSMFNVGDYTFSPYKVVWPRIAASLAAAVVGPVGGKPVIPQETLTLVGTEDAEEAYYLCALINSAPFNLAAQSYAQKGGKSFASAHLLTYLCLPSFRRADSRHRALAALARQAHTLAAQDGAALAALEGEIDRLAAGLWGLTAAELHEIKESLVEPT